MSEKATDFQNPDHVMKDANRLMKWGQNNMTPSRLYFACKFLVIYFEESEGMRLSKTGEEVLRSRNLD
jgi:hypothetical protein